MTYQVMLALKLVYMLMTLKFTKNLKNYRLLPVTIQSGQIKYMVKGVVTIL